jgi:antitoxin component YwqK of YwqJK toxin-antitoxin module
VELCLVLSVKDRLSFVFGCFVFSDYVSFTVPSIGRLSYIHPKDLVRDGPIFNLEEMESYTDTPNTKINPSVMTMTEGLRGELKEYCEGTMMKRTSYINGILRLSQTFVNDELHLEERFASDGTLYARVTHFSDFILTEQISPRTETKQTLKGKITEYRTWHENGQIMTEYDQGTKREYSSEGVLIRVVAMSSDDLIWL